MRVRHINFTDSQGGAARIMNDLIHYQTHSGNDSKALCARVSDPQNGLLSYKGPDHADFALKATHKLSVIRNRFIGDTHGIFANSYLEKIRQEKPAIIHLHNIHGGWFPLTLLKPLQDIAPLVWTLHDEWAYTGHCVATMGCPGYATGCGSCPDLERMVKIWIDTTAKSWKKKHALYRELDHDRVIITPVSHWVSDRIEQSGIWPGQISTVHNGVDVSVFKPKEKQSAKNEIRLSPDARVILFVSTGGGADPLKGSQIIIRELSKRAPEWIIASLGTPSATLQSEKNVIQPGYIKDKEELRNYYSAADIMVYPSNADTFGLVVTEAMACGTPAIAYDVGGIPEIIRDTENGWLVNREIQPSDLISRIKEVLADTTALQRIRENAMETIKGKFTAEIMGSRYDEVYKQLL